MLQFDGLICPVDYLDKACGKIEASSHPLLKPGKMNPSGASKVASPRPGECGSDTLTPPSPPLLPSSMQTARFTPETLFTGNEKPSLPSRTSHQLNSAGHSRITDLVSLCSLQPTIDRIRGHYGGSIRSPSKSPL